VSIRIYQTVLYKITITHDPGEWDWPPLRAARVAYSVTEVQVEVAVHLPSSLEAAPVFDVRPVYATQGRRIEEGGQLGGTMIGRHIYYGKSGGPADRQLKKFEQLALAEAKAAYRQFIDEETERSTHLAR
jgi:hypothetical protein